MSGSSEPPSTALLLLRTASFAAEAHRHQRRKHDDTPYINHPLGESSLDSARWAEGH
jgi:(p)ppGpp synthase/HD superfamily hydrolase